MEQSVLLNIVKSICATGSAFKLWLAVHRGRPGMIGNPFRLTMNNIWSLNTYILTQDICLSATNISYDYNDYKTLSL